MGGYTAILLIEKEEIREQIEQKLLKNLKKSDLVCIIESPQNKVKIEWERPQKEFRFNGNFYDIAFIESKNGINHYYCISDNEETKLEQNLNQSIDIQTDRHSQNKHSVLALRLFLEPVLLKTQPFYNQIYNLKSVKKSPPSLTQTTQLGFLNSPNLPPES